MNLNKIVLFLFITLSTITACRDKDDKLSNKMKALSAGAAAIEPNDPEDTIKAIAQDATKAVSNTTEIIKQTTIETVSEMKANVVTATASAKAAVSDATVNSKHAVENATKSTAGQLSKSKSATVNEIIETAKEIKIEAKKELQETQ